MDDCTAARPAGEPSPYELGAREIETGRRTLLKVGGAGLAFSTAAGLATSSAEAAGRGGTKKRAYVIVVDGTLPEEIDGALTPHLMALRNHGLRHSRAQSMPIMETIPNHVMMMSGVRPDRSGVPANTIYDRSRKEVRTLERSRDLKSDTVIERLNRNGFRTGTVLSKEYLYGIFGTRASHRWEPKPIIPISGHAPDVFTMRAAHAMVERFDPHLMFVNLGDIDRFGHTDFTGFTGIKALRRVALVDTDLLIGRFVAMLKATGRWEHSIVMVLADHSMDWTRPDRIVSLQSHLDDDRFLSGKVTIACNGGADLLYWTGKQADKERAIDRMKTVSKRVRGVHSVHDRTARWMRLGPEAGDVVAFCEAGWRFSDPNPITDNPIPGNHGHLVTRPIPFFIGGGHPDVPRRKASPLLAQTVDVAPTVARFFGLKGSPRGGWDGVNRL